MIGLLFSNSYNTILIVVDQLTKEKYYVLFTINKNNIAIKATVYLLLNNVWQFYSPFLLLTLNWGFQFISKVWKNLCKMFGIKANLSTDFYLKIYRQSKIANQEIEKYLHIFVNYQLNNWLEILVMVEFVANNNKSAFFKLSIFFGTKNLHFRISFDIVKFSNISTCEQIFK